MTSTLPIAQCTGKARLSAGVAHQIAGRKSAKLKPRDAYFCRHCGAYHVGQRIDKQYRKRKPH
jgi:hypothetical protein